MAVSGGKTLLLGDKPKAMDLKQWHPSQGFPIYAEGIGR